MDLEPRHGAHHTVNIKYGYVIFGVSAVYALAVALANHLHNKKWLSQGSAVPQSVWAKMGTRRVWVPLAAWAAIIAAITFFHVEHISENYSVLLKRVGRLGFCVVPLDVLLAIRPSLLATSYLDFIGLHKWFSRLIILAVSIHGAGFLVKWLVEGTFWAKTFKFYNFLGVIISTMCLALLVISAKPVRARIYKWFYLFHNITILAFVVLCIWHARPGVGDFVVLISLMLAFQLFQKIYRTFPVPKLTIIEKENSSLTLLRCAKPAGYVVSWGPGSHARLSYSLSDARSWLFPSHPFTIASLPQDDNIDLIVKKRNAFTVYSSLAYSLSSPFESLPPPFFQTAEQVHIISGGSGVSLGIPIFRLLSQNSSVVCNMSWLTPNKNDIYVLKECGITRPVDIYVTANSTVFTNEDRSEQSNALLNSNDDIEMQSLVDPEQWSQEDSKPKSNVVLHSGRPSFDTLFASLAENNSANTWIIVCGPESMNREVTKWGRDHEVQVFSELYSF